MLVVLGICIVVALAIAGVAVYQYVRPPHGPAVTRHELTPFEAQATSEPSISGVMAGGGPHRSSPSTDGTSWEKKSSTD